MPSSTDPQDNFPYPVLTKITGLPSYDSIKVVNDEISANAASVYSDLGGGNHGFLAITVSPTIYATVSPTPFVAPTNPVPPVIAGMTQHQITALNRRYDANKTKFQQYVSLQNVLKKQLIAAVDEIYLAAISAPYIKYGNLTVYEMLAHLYRTYAKISPADLKENEKKMNSPWDPNLPFEVLVRQVQDAVDFAAHGESPYSTRQIVDTAYTLVYSTGLFHDDCKKWRKRLPPLLQDWPSFKIFFAEAYNDWRETQKTSAGNIYATANATPKQSLFEEETIAAIANLANATAADRAATAHLTATNAKLTEELKATQTKLVTALETIAALNKGNHSPLTDLTNTGRRTRTDTRPPDRHYCWTHGYCCEHTSRKCPSPALKHVKDATARIPKGGSAEKREEWKERVSRINN